MDAFLTRKRPLAELDSNVDQLISPAPSSSLNQPSSPPAKKKKTLPRTADSNTNALRTKKAPAKSKASQTPSHCSLNKKEFGDRIKDCLALEKYEVQGMSFKVNSMLIYCKCQFGAFADSESFQVEMDVAFFKSFFGGDYGVQITPEGNPPDNIIPQSSNLTQRSIRRHNTGRGC